MRHLIVCTPQLKAEDRLEVFAFQKDSTFQTITEIYSMCKGGLFNNVVYAGGEDET